MAFQIDEKDKRSFSLLGYITHTPFFARAYNRYKTFNMHCSKRQRKQMGDDSKLNYIRKWRYFNRCIYAMIDYLKDSFILLSFLNRYYDKIIKNKLEENEKIIYIADCLDELLNRNIKKFICDYYIYDKRARANLKYCRVGDYEKFHYAHRKYYECNNAEAFIKKYLNENLYTRLNIFEYQVFDSIDNYQNNEFISDLEKKIMDQEELFLGWLKKVFKSN